MEDSRFWNEANNGSIRQKVAEFMDSVPALSHLKGDEYYVAEDAIVAFIKTNKEAIYREVDKEYQREDVINYLQEKSDDETIEKSVDELNEIVDIWQEELFESDAHWETVWDALGRAIDNE